ncbi:UDP-3-O-acyl-N-acetylglucosamine deacetylase 5 precursor [Tanacetum coccineum]
MMMYKGKKNHVTRNMQLICITVIGSASPIRFVVNVEEVVGNVMDTTYTRMKRLPILGLNINDFVMYYLVTGTEALNPLVVSGWSFFDGRNPIASGNNSSSNNNNKSKKQNKEKNEAITKQIFNFDDDL